MDWPQNVSLTRRNTFGLTSQTRYFALVDSVDALRAQLECAREKGIDFFVLGGGSNVVLPQRYDGLTIAMGLRGIRVERDTRPGRVRVVAHSGEGWHALVRRCLGLGIFGLENLALIPGKVGAAPIQNVGAYGVELSAFVDFVEAMDVTSGLIVRLSPEECGFGYRDSAFKRELAGRMVITAVALSLHTQPSLVLDYPDLRAELDAMGIARPRPLDVSEAVIRVRRRKLPDPRFVGNAGSFFKNPLVSRDVLGRLRREEPDIPYVEGDAGYKLAAAWLIDRCGWKGKRCGPVGVWKHHALVIVRYAEATREDVLKLAKSIKESVKARFSVELAEEPIMP